MLVTVYVGSNQQRMLENPSKSGLSRVGTSDYSSKILEYLLHSNPK